MNIWFLAENWIKHHVSSTVDSSRSEHLQLWLVHHYLTTRLEKKREREKPSVCCVISWSVHRFRSCTKSAVTYNPKHTLWYFFFSIWHNSDMLMSLFFRGVKVNFSNDCLTKVTDKSKSGLSIRCVFPACFSCIWSHRTVSCLIHLSEISSHLGTQKGEVYELRSGCQSAVTDSAVMNPRLGKNASEHTEPPANDPLWTLEVCQMMCFLIFDSFFFPNKCLLLLLFLSSGLHQLCWCTCCPLSFVAEKCATPLGRSLWESSRVSTVPPPLLTPRQTGLPSSH